MLSFRFGTVGSPDATPPRPGGTLGGIKYTAEIGLNALELAWVRAVRISEAACAVIQKAGDENEVAISIHAPYFINLNADDEEWPKSRKRLMDAARFGHLAGATDIVFHPGTYFDRPAGEVLSAILPRLQDCVNELRTAGNPVTLRPETMGKSAMLGSLEDTLEMARAIPGVVPCVDFAHLHARRGDGSMNTYAEWMGELALYRKVLGDEAMQHMHIHLSGIQYGLKGERNHLVLEEADMDFKALFRALHASGARGRIMCESPVLEVDALKFKAMWLKESGEE